MAQSSLASFFTDPHMAQGGGPETLDSVRQAASTKASLPPGPPVPLPPILEGLYRTLYPTPAETGELPQRYWPSQVQPGTIPQQIASISQP